MRSYYRSYRWTPSFTPAPSPASSQPAGKAHTVSRGAVIFFSISLAVILILAVTLGALTLSPGRTSALPDSWPDSYDYDDSKWAGVPPTIRRVEPGGTSVLMLVSAAEAQELTFQENYAKNIDAIVGVHVDGPDFTGFGTGVIMSSDGYIITNAHVVEGGRRVSVSLYDGTYLGCELVGFDPYSDLAVLKASPSSPLPVAEFGDSSELQVGDIALALGNPLGTELWGTMTDGIISAINRDVVMDDGTTMTLIQTTAAINSGNSGGALLNSRGQVVGITNMKIIADDNTIEGLGFAIPTSTVKEVVDSMIATGSYPGTPSLGITAAVLPNDDGVLVRSVNPASDAFAQGLREGDLITAVNGQPVYSVTDINALKEGYAIGDVLTLTVQRGRETLNIPVQLVGSYSLN